MSPQISSSVILSQRRAIGGISRLSLSKSTHAGLTAQRLQEKKKDYLGESMAELKAGARLKSAVCSTEVMIVKAAGGELSCGGVAMLGAGEDAPAGASANADHMTGCQVGKRYVNEDQSLEALCVKAGEGSLSIDGTALTIKDAKKLPSSD